MFFNFEQMFAFLHGAHLRPNWVTVLSKQDAENFIVGKLVTSSVNFLYQSSI